MRILLFIILIHQKNYFQFNYIDSISILFQQCIVSDKVWKLESNNMIKAEQTELHSLCLNGLHAGHKSFVFAGTMRQIT